MWLQSFQTSGSSAVVLSEIYLECLCQFEKCCEPLGGATSGWEDFVADLSGFLRELDCPYQTLYNGPYEARLASQLNKATLISYLVRFLEILLHLIQFYFSEIQTAKIIGANSCASENGVLDSAGKEAYQYLKRTIQLLEMGKPPKTIDGEKLFAGIVTKIDKICGGKSVENLIGKAMLTNRLTPMHMGRD